MSNKSGNTWSMDSWRNRPAKQQPHYKDPASANDIIKRISSLAPLVHLTEVEELKMQLIQVSKGERFLLQAGDCAEKFVDCNKSSIANRLKVLVQMSQVLSNTGLKIVVVGRIAGQYAKPRSTLFDVHDGQRINVFKGDNINGLEWNDREHDPTRLLFGYFHSAATLNYIRALIKEGFAALPHWNNEKVGDDVRCRYEEIAAFAQQVDRSRFELFTSHEGLVLDYEEALTRDSLKSDPSQQQNLQFYNLGAHFVWIGKRTRDVDDAHVEYFRGISNPIGIKIDSELSAQELVKLLDILDPDRIPGRVTLISRFGYEKVVNDFPERIEAVKRACRGETVIWSCDPMHGNTYTTSENIRTRNFDHILSELTDTLKILRKHGCRLGGIHLESTGENVTECIGGPQKIDETQLNLRYMSHMDPRLNYIQSLEIAFLLAKQLS